MKRGKRIAFGDGRRIIWDQHSPAIFRGNPNIAPLGSEHRHDIEWCRFHKGHRIYNHHDEKRKRWVWNMDFRPTPGEIFLDQNEKAAAAKYGDGFILIEPHIEQWKASAANKDWGREKYQQVAGRLIRDGHRLIQFVYGRSGSPLTGVMLVRTDTFREAMAIMANASIYVGPEGGLHHAAAALDIPGVVLFGGFIPPSVTGYEIHRNLTGVATEACGSLYSCKHCRAAMQAISVDEVHAAASEILNGHYAAGRRPI